MSFALLIATDQVVIDEFTKMVAITESPLIIEANPSRAQISGAYRIFIESAQVIEDLSHEEIVIVSAQSPGAKAWKLAIALEAKTVVGIEGSHDWFLENLIAPTSQIAEVITLVPIVGGSGASTLASAMAAESASKGRRVCLVDIDPQGGGIDLVCGAEEIPGARWPDLVEVDDISGADLLRSLPECSGVRILAMRSEAITAQKVDQILRTLLTAVDLIYIDCAQDVKSYWQSISDISSQILLVLPTTVRATTVAKQNLESQVNDKFGLVVRQLPGTGLTPAAIAQTLGISLKAQLVTDSRVVEQIEQGVGLGRVSIGAFSKQVTQLCVDLELV